MNDLEKPRILEMSVSFVHDIYGRPDWMGEYSNEPGEGAIDLWERYGERRDRLRYFTPCDPENAEEDLERYEDFEKGKWSLMGVDVRVTVFTVYRGLWLKSEFRESLWGICSDSEEEYIDECAIGCLENIQKELKTLGIEWNEEMAEYALQNPKTP